MPPSEIPAVEYLRSARHLGRTAIAGTRPERRRPACIGSRRNCSARNRLPQATGLFSSRRIAWCRPRWHTLLLARVMLTSTLPRLVPANRIDDYRSAYQEDGTERIPSGLGPRLRHSPNADAALPFLLLPELRGEHLGHSFQAGDLLSQPSRSALFLKRRRFAHRSNRFRATMREKTATPGEEHHARHGYCSLARACRRTGAL